MQQRTLAHCLDEGIPLFRFGSQELSKLHLELRDPPEMLRLTSNGPIVTRQAYGWQGDGFRYIVDHGSFFTLNRLQRGQVCPFIEDLQA
jgi:hypothetical protein